MAVEVAVPTAAASFSLEANVYGACGATYAYGLTWTQPITPHGLSQSQCDPVSFLDMLVSAEDPVTPERNDVVLVVTEGGAFSSPTSSSTCKRAAGEELVEPCKKQKVSAPSSPPTPSSFVTSPMASRYLACRPTVPSPLCPSPSSQFTQQSAPPRRRSRCKEIGLFKLALDPWLRLSRALDTIQPDTSGLSHSSSFDGGDQKPTIFNPATFPSAGNLRELRKKEPVLQLPFTFDDESNRIRASALRFGDPFGASPWGVVDA